VIVPVLLLLACGTGRAALQDDLHAGFDPERLDAWHVHPAGELRAAVVEEDVHEGRSCVRLERERASARGQDAYFFQAMDARASRGTRFRLKAALRLESEVPGSRVDLWAKVWRTGNRPGEERDLGLDGVREAEWTEVSLLVDVPADALSLQFGVRLTGLGTAHLDALAIEPVGPVGQGLEDPAPLAGRELENVRAFARLLGVLRYFHPSDGAADLDWHAFAIAGVKRVRAAPDAAALAAALTELVTPFAPTVQVFAAGEDPPLPAGLRAPEDAAGLEVVSWHHSGLGRPGGGIYTSERQREPAEQRSDETPDPERPFEAELPGGVRARVPLALWARGAVVLPASRAPTHDVYASVDDRDTRLAIVALAWNMPQHFFPYFERVGDRWGEALVEALQSAATDRDRAEFRRTLERLTWHLHDGHAWVEDDSPEARLALPLFWAWIEGALIVTAVDGAQRDDLPRVGDEVLAIGDRPALEVIEEEERLVSASGPVPLRRRALERLLTGPPNVRLWLEVASPEGERRRVGPPFERPRPLAEPRPETIAELRPGVWYVDIDRATDRDYGEILLAALAEARGLVFDLRGYPKAVTAVACFLADTPMVSPTWGIPQVRRPDREGMRFGHSNWPAGPAEPHFRAPTVFLTDARAQSAAETYLSFVEQYRLAEIVGQPTAGTNGNINRQPLPCGFTFSFTGMLVLKQDGGEHHGVGIRPTIPLERTRRGVVEGRDELLERALAEIERARAEGRGAGAEPRTAQDFLYQASLADQREDAAGVVAAASRAIDLAPDDGFAYAWRAFGHLKTRASSDALEDLERAEVLTPGDTWVALLRGRARRDLGRGAEARADLLRATEDPTSEVAGFAWWLLGLLDLEAGDLEKAGACFDRLLEVDESSTRGHLGRLALAHARQEWKTAVAEIERMARLQRSAPNEAGLFEWLVRTRAGDAARANRDLERAAKRWEGKPEAAWVQPFVDFLLGRADEDVFLANWPEGAPELRSSLAAAAAFWAGARRELDGDLAGARAFYTRCVDAGCWDELPYVLARARLEATR